MAAIERDNPRLKGVLPKDYALPGQLFYSTQIPVYLWFLAKNKSGSGVSPLSSSAKRQDAASTLRDRRKQTLFIDARKLGTLIDRVHRELTDADLEKITIFYDKNTPPFFIKSPKNHHEFSKTPSPTEQPATLPPLESSKI